MAAFGWFCLSVVVEDIFGDYLDRFVCCVLQTYLMDYSLGAHLMLAQTHDFTYRRVTLYLFSETLQIKNDGLASVISIRPSYPCTDIRRSNAISELSGQVQLESNIIYNYDYIPCRDQSFC